MGFIAPENITFRDGRPHSTTEGGVPYVSFIVKAVVPEGGKPPTGCATLDEAWSVFNESLAGYLRAERASTVEWRIPPTEDSMGDPESDTFYRIRARLAVVETTDGP